MAHPNAQTGNPKPGGNPQKPAQPVGKAAGGNEAIKAPPDARREPAANDPDDDWGLADDSRGMSRETKIGLFVIVLLMLGFGFVMFKKLDKNDQMLASIKRAVGLKSTEDGPDKPDTDEMDQADPDKADPDAGELLPIPQAEPTVQHVARAESIPQHRHQHSHDEFAQHDDGFHATQDENPFAGQQHAAQHSSDFAEQEFGADLDQQPTFADPRQTAQNQASDDFAQNNQQFGEFEQSPHAQYGTEQQHSHGGEFEPADDFSATFEPTDDGRSQQQSFQPQDQFADDREFNSGQTAQTDDWSQWNSSSTASNSQNNFSAEQTFPGDQDVGQPFPADSAQQQDSWNTAENDGFVADFGDEPQSFQQTTVETGQFGGEHTHQHSQQDAFNNPSQFSDGDNAASGFAPDDFNSGQYQTTNDFGSEPQSHQTTDLFGRHDSFSAGDTPNDPNVGVYVLQKNDNYWSISKSQYGTPRYFNALARYNRRRIPDPTRMKVGTKVLIPSPQVLESRYPDLFPKPRGGAVASTSGSGPGFATAHTDAKFSGGMQPSGFFVSKTGEPMYRTSRSDTLGGIAQRHLGRASRWLQIFELNRDRLQNPNDLKIGLVLRLPGDASGVNLMHAAQSGR